jgi:hypothetical protein
MAYGTSSIFPESNLITGSNYIMFDNDKITQVVFWGCVIIIVACSIRVVSAIW